jgi:hypothetical protein
MVVRNHTVKAAGPSETTPDLDGDFDEPDEADDDDELLRDFGTTAELDEDERDVEDH